MGARGVRTDGNLFFRLIAFLLFLAAAGAVVAAGVLVFGHHDADLTDHEASLAALGAVGAAVGLAWMGAVVWLLDEIAGRGA